MYVMTFQHFLHYRDLRDTGLGLGATPFLRWGLGAVILMLIVSTVFSLGKKLLPTILDNLPREAGGRSLEDLSSLAQHAFDAFEKYQLLNEN